MLNMTYMHTFLDTWLEKYVNTIYAETTKEVYNNYVQKVFKPNLPNKPLKYYKEIDILNFIESINKKISKTTLLTYIKILRLIFNIAIKLKYIKENPTRYIRLKSVKNIKYLDFSKEYLQELINLFNDSKIYNIILVALFTGCRRGEILGIKVKDILFADKKLIIKRNVTQTTSSKIIVKTPKNGRTRIIEINTPLCSLFKILCKDKRGVFI